MRRLLVLFVLLLVACAADPVRGGSPARSAEASFHWPTPAGWRAETLPFPLRFAPALAYHGSEEIRFAPRFFDPTAETYFSYSFVWLLDDAPAFDATRVGTDLERYFSGLSRAVAPTRFDPAKHHARITGQGRHYRGVVETVDSFGDGRDLSLVLEGEEVTCGARRGIVLSLSPQPAEHRVWSLLSASRRSASCS